MVDAISLIFSQQFLVRALFVGIMISLCCALLGVSLVLKRFSMIGDGLSHVGFGSMAIACAANVAPLYFSLPIVLVSAFLLLRMNEKGKIKGDAAIALISTGALAVGVMVTSVTTGMNVDIYNYMFGSILTMSKDDVVITAIISSVIIALFVLFYDEIFAITFDESFAQATGTKTSFYNMLIAGLTAVTIVIGMRMMGALLISSLIIFPTVTSMRLCKSFRSVVITSAVVSIICFIAGLILSVEYETPTGASIVCINIYALAFFSVVSAIRKHIKKPTLYKAVSVAVSIIFIATPLVVSAFNKAEFASKTDISIVTTGFAEYDFAREIVGDKGDVTMLLSPGEESHTYEPTPSDIVKIQQCDVFVFGGGESDKWADKIIGSADTDFSVVKMMEVTDVCTLEHNHEEEHEEERDHGEYDEHVWTSPVKAIEIVRAICDAICEIDEANAGYYIGNAEKYIASLRVLDEKFRALSEKFPDKYIVIGDRFPLRYLMLEYDIEYYAAFSGCSAQVEVNPTTISNLNEMIKKDGIKSVLKVDLSKGDVAKSISEATGAEVDTLYSCHIISAEDLKSGESYISLMNRNYKAIEKALNY